MGSPAGLRIRPAQPDDLPTVIAMDAETTGLAKPEYWGDLFERYVHRGRDRYFLMAEIDGGPIGFIIGEIRAWEFGSPPAGWVFALNVKPGLRQAGIGSILFEAICAGFRKAGITLVRTMLARDDLLVMSFFRGQGMMAGPFIQLEKDIGP